MQTLSLIMFSAYLLGALVALSGGKGNFRRGLIALAAIIGAGAGLVLGASVLLSGVPFTLSIPELLPLTGLALRLDGLGAPRDAVCLGGGQRARSGR